MSENHHSMESERRIATVMFADIAGFTAMSDRMDPEEVTGVMNACFRMMEDCIDEHGGTIDKFIGDCVMVLFGAPKALEDAPQRAVNTAIELRNRLNRFNQKQHLSIPLDIHVGINTGLVVSGMVGGDRKREFTVMGDTVNLASRIEGASHTGQILVGPATYKATRDSFSYKPLEPIELKGKAEPVPVYELLSVKETVHRAEPGTDRMIASAMVGRDNELALLESLVSKAMEGHGAIVSMTGEAGIGKSRLIAELRQREIMRQVAILEGRAISIGANLGYHLIIDLLKNWAGIKEDDTEALAFTRLEAAIRTTHPEALGEILPFVATLMGFKLTGRHAERVKGIEGEALEKLILKNVRDLIIQGATRTPLVIILEDLHWADISSIELLESLLRLAAKTRIVFIMISRPGYAETGERVLKTIREEHAHLATEIALAPLDEQQTATLIDNLLNIKGFPPRLKAQITERAGGNPYFIEEVVRSFIDDGAVVLKGEGFAVTDRLASQTIPRTINEVLMARIDRLDQQTRELVKTAAVIGRSFFYRILAEVSRNVEAMDERLEHLQEIQLIRERMRMEEIEYLFKHALAQEVAYDSILVQRRKELHRLVADSFEKIFQARLHEFYGMLAFHYSQAEDLEKTEEYLIKAGEESLKSSASAEALHHYRQALELYLMKHGDQADPAKVAMLEKNIAMALFNRGQYAESIPYFDKALAFDGLPLPQHPIPKTLIFCAGFLKFLINIYFPFLMPRKKPTQRDKEINILNHKECMALGACRPKESFIRVFSTTHLTTDFDLDKFEYGAGILAMVSVIFSWPGISFTLSKRCLETFRSRIDTHDARAVMHFKMAEIVHNGLSGAWPEQIPEDDGLVARNLELGEFITPTSFTQWICFFDLHKGNIPHAQQAIQKIAAIGEAYNHDWVRMISHYMQTYLWVRCRDGCAARQSAAQTIHFYAGKTSFDIFLITIYALQARAELLLGDRERAAAAIEQAKRIMSETDAVPQQRGELFLSMLYMDLLLLEEDRKNGDKHASVQHSSHALKNGTKAVAMANKHAPYKTEALKLMGVYYWLIGNQCRAIAWWRKAMAEGQRLDDRLELSRTYFEIGKRLSEPTSKHKSLDGITAGEYLTKARAMFEEMDLQWDLAELEKLRI